MPQRRFSMYGPTREALRAAFEDSARHADAARSMPSVLRAAGSRIEPAATERMRIQVGVTQQWQSLAWAYRDFIGELRFALQFRAKAISKVKLYIAQVDPDDPEEAPVPVALRTDEDEEKRALVTLPPDICTAAEQELSRLPLADGYGFLGVWSENFDVAGECYLHGYVDPATEVEVWKIRSVDNVDTQGADVTVKDELGRPRRVDLDSEELYRLWVPHPRNPHLADSALNALVDVLEDIVLTGRELRAAARSRIMTNGLALIPDGMVRVRNTKDESDNNEDKTTRFMNDFTAGLLAPISNEGDAGAVVPMVLTGSREDIAAVRHMKFEREDSPTLLLKMEKSLGRMASSLDIPPEIITGMADVNHWTAWQIDNATFRQYLETSIRLMVDSLTAAVIRTKLTLAGFPPEQVARIRVWYSAGQLTENPNRRQDTLDALDRMLIGPAAGRDGLGFSDSDAPTPEEILQMIAAKQGIDTSAAAAILAWAAQQDGVQPPVLPTVPSSQIPAARPPATSTAPDPAGTGGTGTPSTAPPSVAASARPLPNRMGVDEQQLADLVRDLNAYADQAPSLGYRLDTATARSLMEIERALRDNLLQTAEAAFQRARERAGNRFRSKATKDPSIAASLAAFYTWDWPRQVGREQCLALGADARFLLAEAWEDLGRKFTRWVLAAIDRIVPGVLKITGYEPGSAQADRAGRYLRDQMSGRVATAWEHLRDRLNELAEQAVFDGIDSVIDSDAEGEVPEVDVPPYLMRVALAEVGGLTDDSGGLDEYGRPVGGEPITGLHNGAAVADVLEEAGVITLGYLWVYGVTPLKRQFEPHRELEGVKFSNWGDPQLEAPARYQWIGPFFRPGDHRGCMCDYVPGYAIPEYGDQVRRELAIPTRPTQDILDLAASDDLAGRTGTTAQEVRDQWRAIQTLQARFIEEG